MISIITAVLNGEQFIECAIQNLINQNCLNFEHIIVDGNSTDRTVDIIKKYANKYSHIRWFSEPDNGESDALNKGISLAKGEILGILDYDDFYEPNVLNNIEQIFKTLPEPSILVGNTRYLENEDKLKWIEKTPYLSIVDLLSGKNSHPSSASSYFYHKSLHQRIGLYDVNNHYQMDADFIYRAVQVAYVKYIDKDFANRRHHEKTKTLQHWNSGQGSIELERLKNKYLKMLPLFQRWQIRFYRLRKSIL